MGILEVKGVNKRFGGLQALGDVNLSVQENSVHAIIGPNGAGKTTTIKMITRLLAPVPYTHMTLPTIFPVYISVLPLDSPT